MYLTTFLLPTILPLVCSLHYTPDWNSLDSRPLPTWYDEAKIGIFIHWGVWSVPGYGPKTESAFLEYDLFYHKQAALDFMKKNYPPGYTYADFGADFKGEFFNAQDWADLLRDAGARYVVFVSKHCDGYALWKTKYSWNWNSMDVGLNRNVVEELEYAIRNRTQMRFGLYYCLYEWVNPLYLVDVASHFKTQRFVEQRVSPQRYELVNQYKPDLIWSDGDWDAPDTYWNSTNFLAWLYNESPVKDQVIVNDRWGIGSACRHGGYFNCKDKFNPKVLMKHKFENALTLDIYSWGYRKSLEARDVLTMKNITTILAQTISCGGNMLLNVGPMSSGVIPPIFEERLRRLGAWLKVNGEAVYASKPWTHQNDSQNPDVWYTKKMVKSVMYVYAFVLNWPEDGILAVSSPIPSKYTTVTMLGYNGGNLYWEMGEGYIHIWMPKLTPSSMPCHYAWVLKLTNIFN